MDVLLSHLIGLFLFCVLEFPPFTDTFGRPLVRRVIHFHLLDEGIVPMLILRLAAQLE
jgi:hypothetical protein